MATPKQTLTEKHLPDVSVASRLGEPSQVSSGLGRHSDVTRPIGIRDVIVRLEEQLADRCEQDRKIKDETVDDGYCLAIDGDEVDENLAGDDFQEQGEMAEIDEGNDPSGLSARLARCRRTVPRPWPQKKNMTYSHEQRIQMGYFAAKCGMRALKNKYVGLKDSTGRDMLKYVLHLVREGKLSLDVPIEKQIIPPKTRNGAPVIGTYKVLMNRELQQDISDETSPPQSQLDNGERATLQKAQIAVSAELADYDASLSLHVPFEDKVKIGFHAALHGSHAAVRKFEVTDSLVKECRNLVIKLSRSGLLNLDIPLEDQAILEDPSRIVPKRLTKYDHQVPQARMHPDLPQLQQDSQASVHAPEQLEKHTGVGEYLAPLKPQDQPTGSQQGIREVSLDTDLAFFRWRNRRTSLGFQSDRAFAMHLMDVHDAFCTGQCCGRDTHTLSN